MYFGPLSIGSVDHALIQYGGGRTTIEGGFDNFDAVEIHQAQVRITNSTLQHNAPGGGGDRNGRGTATPAIIFVIGAQPVIVNNVIQNNDTTATANPNTAAISINVNSLNSTLVNDWGRSTGKIDLQGDFNANTGPLIHGNKLANNPINGMIVRGGEITTNVVWDDTDIVHVLEDQVIAGNAHSTSGTIRLQSSDLAKPGREAVGRHRGLHRQRPALGYHRSHRRNAASRRPAEPSRGVDVIVRYHGGSGLYSQPVNCKRIRPIRRESTRPARRRSPTPARS